MATMRDPPPAAESSEPRTDTIDLEDYFMAVAILSSRRSKDPRTQVGACIVNQEKKIVGIGYNEMPNGCDGFSWNPDTKHRYVCHAAMNAIMNKNSADVKGCTMYTVLFPCNECAKLIIQSGLEEIVYLSDKKHYLPETTASKALLEKAGIKTREFEPKEKDKKINQISLDSTDYEYVDMETD